MIRVGFGYRNIFLPLRVVFFSNSIYLGATKLRTMGVMLNLQFFTKISTRHPVYISYTTPLRWAKIPRILMTYRVSPPWPLDSFTVCEGTWVIVETKRRLAHG